MNFIDGRFATPTGSEELELHSPVDGSLLTTIRFSSDNDLERAVASAQRAFESWGRTPIKERAQIFYRYRQLLQQHTNELASVIHQENGKTISEAVAEIDKSIEVTEFACSLPQLATGELLEVSKGVECRNELAPLGVVSSIVPFNFPVMVPHWTIPIALAMGNCMVLKPSEKTPLSSSKIALLLKEAGLPDGAFNIVNGGKGLVQAICRHPAIEAVSFVGSTAAAKDVYRAATHALKRCLALGGAKNHLIVLPDAQQDMSAKNIVASMSGCAGQRCMAASAMIAVGETDPVIQKICEEARKLVPGKDIGSIISQEAKDRIERYIDEAAQQGAKVLVDGRRTTVKGKEKGYYIGPTVIDQVTPDMAIAKEELFGPVICIMRVNTVDEALDIENKNRYGNATAVFTQNGAMARYIGEKANAGMIGVNIGVPVPREPFSFGGWNESKFGTGDITGKSSLAFWSKIKKTTTKWQPEAGMNWMS